MTDQEYMRLALELAERGRGWVNPNPMVGAVIVKDDRIIGQGWHHRYGDLHAERDALKSCSESPAGATIYVTLEPCCHHGKQPPCTDAIRDAGIARVVVGSGDPNPLVAGKGLALLEQAGIEVCTGVLEEECRALNKEFFHYIQTKRPYVTMKYAMTLDGKIACHTGEARWVTGEVARAHAHSLRHQASAILVGVGTVLADDPMLNCRLEKAKNPLRVICDSKLRTPLCSRLVTSARDIPTLIATTITEEEALEVYRQAGCQVLSLPAAEGQVDLNALLEALGAQGISHLLVEGGGQMHWSFLNQGLVNQVKAYIAPKLFGGAEAKTPIEGQGYPLPSLATELDNLTITRLGADILLEGEVKPSVYRNC